MPMTASRARLGAALLPLLGGCRDLTADTQSLLVPSLTRSEVLGFLAGLGTTFASVPDLVSMLRRKSAAGMNPRMSGIMGAFQLLWIWYGLVIQSRPIVLWNLVGVLTNTLCVGAFFYFARAERKRRA